MYQLRPIRPRASRVDPAVRAASLARLERRRRISEERRVGHGSGLAKIFGGLLLGVAVLSALVVSPDARGLVACLGGFVLVGILVGVGFRVGTGNRA